MRNFTLTGRQYKPVQSDDITEDYQFVVTESLLDLYELLEQKQANKPKGENSLRQWSKDIAELNKQIKNYGKIN